ncbi:putative DASH complex subunit Spc34 [Elsinoe australis]|uniref:DASH complex subunit SPC34 n=1 Tax=Elsinoe australis TaxID=40998 RepID=A0A4U7AWZ0_9PEZI|nr:putative DASH complex subunit Spc34 [Elsinoe australis]
MVTSLLSSHLEQITACAASISELEFPKPKQFENSLLSQHDITALIRDTEIHERALFSIAPPPFPAKQDQTNFSGSTISGRPSVAPNASRAPKRNTAVAAVLGRDLFRKVREADGSSATTSYGSRNRAKGEIDVEVLLQGASRLCDVYPVPGAGDEIARLRARFEQLSANIAHYEDRVARNSKQLDGMYARQGYGDDDVEEETGLEEDEVKVPVMTKEDLEMEEREIRELERKKRGLESRVSEMEKDLGGLMR